MKVSEDTQSPVKRSKADKLSKKLGQDNQEGAEVCKKGSTQSSGKQVQQTYWPAPPKIDYKAKG
jgi:hypothetical protein